MTYFKSLFWKLKAQSVLFILPLALASAIPVLAMESPTLKIELRGKIKTLTHTQVICTENQSLKSKGKDLSENLNDLGFKINFSADCKSVRVFAESTPRISKEDLDTQRVFVTYPFEIELEGDSSLSLEVAAQKIKIPSHWSSQNLFVTSNFGEKPTFINLGTLEVNQLKLGDLLHPLAQFQNETGGTIKAQEISGVLSDFQNSGRLESQKKFKLFGKTFQNTSGSLVATGEMNLSFNTIKNKAGSIYGSQVTTLHIAGSLENQSLGIIGSSEAITELDFGSQGSSSHLGEIHGSEVHLTLNHSHPVEIATGSIHAGASVSIFSPVKVFLPSVTIQTPILNLSLPDFQIEPLTECNTTVIHCNPEKNFCLTSDFVSQGEVRFLESDYCRTRTQQEKEEANKNPEDSTLEAQVSQALLSLRTQAHHSELMITNKTQELLQKSKEMEIYFQQDHGTHSQYPVGIEAQISADQGIHMLLPEGRVILGRESKGKEIGIYTSNLLIRANYYQQVSGSVSAEKALLSVPSGMDLGFLEKDENQKVKVGDKEFPLYRRGNALWTTQGDCLIRGPFRCSGTLEIGGNLILDSEKQQYSDSPDINVHGNLIFKGEGDFKVSRDIGTVWYDREAKSDIAHYAEESKFRVDGKTIPESSKKIELIASHFYTDEITGPKLSFTRQEVLSEKPIHFPGEEAKKDFRTEISTRKEGFLRLEGPKSEGIISTTEVYLIEDEGQFVLFAKNPYFIEATNPLHKLSLNSQEQRSPKVYHEQNLHALNQDPNQNSSHFSYEWRERTFFSPAESREWLENLAQDIVIFEKESGILSLVGATSRDARDEGKVIFELSPKLLLAQVQKAVSDTLKRSYIDADRPLDLDYLQILHQNTTRLMKSSGIAWEPSNQSSPISGKHFEKILNEPGVLGKLEKPFLFYRTEKNAQGVRILKPELILPSNLLEKARSQQNGNVFGEVLGRLYAGATIEQILDRIDQGTPNGDKLREILTKNQTIIDQINDSAKRYEEKLKSTPDFKRQRDDLNIDQQLKSQNISIVMRDDITISSDQKGGSVDFVSLNGDAKILSEKKVHSGQKDPNQEEIERRKLKYQGHFNLRAGRHIETQAIDLEADSGRMKAEAGVLDHTIQLESQKEIQSEGYTKKTKSTHHETSQFKLKNGFRVEGNKIYFIGTQAEAGQIQIEGQEEVQVLGVNDTKQTDETREEETGAWFWKGKKKEIQQSSTSTFKVARLNATQESVEIKSKKEVTLQAPEIQGKEIRVEAESVKIKLGKNTKSTSSSKSGENAFWINVDTDQRTDESHTQLSALGKIKIKATKLELEEAQCQALKYLEQLEYDPKRLELVKAILEEIHTHEHDSISAPGPALIAAVAIASSIATAGVGGAIVGTAGSAATAAASAAISSLSAQIVTQLTIGILAQQSPDDIMGKIFSTDTLKNIATATVSAGALYDVGCLQNAAGTCVPLKHLENAGVQAGVGITADVAFGDKNLGDALTSGGIQFTSQFLGSTAASEIGDHFKDKHGATDRILHKAAHGISAAGIAAGGAALTGQDVGSAALAGAAGAMTAEIVADLLTQPFNEEIYAEVQNKQSELGRELTINEKETLIEAKIKSITTVSKLSGAVSGMFASGAQGISTGQAYASNAIENNWLGTVALGLGTAYMAYEWERSNVVTDDAIVSDPVGETLLLGSAAAGVKGLAKGAQKLGPAIYKAGKGFVQAAQESEIIGNEIGSIGNIAEQNGKIANSGAKKLNYEANPKHKTTQVGNASPAPTNPVDTLNKSVEFSPYSTRRVAVDKKTGEMVIFAEHNVGKGDYHGYQVRWEELTEAMKSALIKSGQVNHRGKVL